MNYAYMFASINMETVFCRLMFPPAPFIIQLLTSHSYSPLNARHEEKRIIIFPHQYLDQ